MQGTSQARNKNSAEIINKLIQAECGLTCPNRIPGTQT